LLERGALKKGLKHWRNLKKKKENAGREAGHATKFGYSVALITRQERSCRSSEIHGKGNSHEAGDAMREPNEASNLNRLGNAPQGC